MNKTFTVHDLPQSERPRERLQQYGPEALSIHELLSIILSKGVRGESVMTTGHRILSQFGSLEKLQEASLEELQTIRGLGLAKAAQLKACFEIGRRVQNAHNQQDNQKKKSVISPEQIFQLIRSKIGNYAKEHFIVISFDTRNKVLGTDTISIGTLNASLVHPRETFDPAIRRHAASIIVAHNHPSGDPTPSDEDIKVTKKLIDAGKLLDIQLLDHVIITKTTFYSFSQKT